jgi:hypothetical protein
MKTIKRLLLGLTIMLLVSCSQDDSLKNPISNDVCLCDRVVVTNSSSFVVKNECDGNTKTYYNSIWGNQTLNTCFSPENLSLVNNNNIPYRIVSLTINKNLPVYSSINFTGYYVINDNIIIYNNGYKYRAYDMRSPDNPQIILNITQPVGFGIDTSSNAICPVTGKIYLLGIGSTIDLNNTLKEYNVTLNDNNIFVTN